MGIDRKWMHQTYYKLIGWDAFPYTYQVAVCDLLNILNVHLGSYRIINTTFNQVSRDVLDIIKNWSSSKMIVNLDLQCDFVLHCSNRHDPFDITKIHYFLILCNNNKLIDRFELSLSANDDTTTTLNDIKW